MQIAPPPSKRAWAGPGYGNMSTGRPLAAPFPDKGASLIAFQPLFVRGSSRSSSTWPGAC
jgi:hypothetical protein